VNWPWTRGGAAGEDLRQVLNDASEEASRRGERRLGTDHLLLAVLHDPHSPVVQSLGASLADARSAADRLDAAALQAIGVSADIDKSRASSRVGGRLPPLTSGAREVLRTTIEAADPRRTGHIGAEHLLRALLLRRRPDPAAELLDALGVDRAAVEARLSAMTKGGLP
jgi:ATP-dependent Clp protease ATP-binding subunit ClpA